MKKTTYPCLLDALKKLRYEGNYEIVMVNDHSEDESTSIVDNTELHTKLLHLNKKENGKKAALTKGIESAQFDWILTTDADCIVPENWLIELNEQIQDQTDMVVMPVLPVNSGHWIGRMFNLEYLALQGMTFAFGRSLFLASGANLAFRKRTFNAVSGYSGNETIKSGDDVFLLKKFIRKNPKAVRYHKGANATVLSVFPTKLSCLIRQRKRWFFKMNRVFSTPLLVIAFGAYLANLLVVMGWGLELLYPASLWFWLLFVFLKLSIDYLFLFLVEHSLGKNGLLKHYLTLAAGYSLYIAFAPFIVLLVAGKWKGRKLE